jgi:hypothetical protein
MKQVFKIRKDGTFDFSDSIVVQHDIPEGYGLTDPSKSYRDDGTELTSEEINEVRGETIEQLKERKIKELDQACNEAILGRFPATVGEIDYDFSFDAEAQANFTGTLVLFTNETISEVEWSAYLGGEKVRITLTKEQLTSVAMTAFAHKDSLIKRFNNDLLPLVQLATTKEELDVIEW